MAEVRPHGSLSSSSRHLVASRFQVGPVCNLDAANQRGLTEDKRLAVLDTRDFRKRSRQVRIVRDDDRVGSSLWRLLRLFLEPRAIGVADALHALAAISELGKCFRIGKLRE